MKMTPERLQKENRRLQTLVECFPESMHIRYFAARYWSQLTNDVKSADTGHFITVESLDRAFLVFAGELKIVDYEGGEFVKVGRRTQIRLGNDWMWKEEAIYILENFKYKN